MNWFEIGIGLIGGLSLFLYGMVQMTNALKSAAGSSLTKFLAKMTRNRWTAVTAGAGITAIIQSSSVTTVLVVGFVSAGLMEFSKTLGIILGANIGTTITAQIIAFKVTDAALAIVAVGYLITAVSKKHVFKDYGTILLGLGLVFLGMNLMSHATMPLRQYDAFIDLMKEAANPFIGILLGAVFTGLVQSSSATTGVVIVLSAQGLLNIETGIAMIIGANIGTCVTAILASIGKPRPAVKVALAHVVFNTLGAIVFVFFIPQLSLIAETISPNDTGRQIANAHTIFNVANAALFIGFPKVISKLITKILPDKEVEVEDIPHQSVPLLDDYYLKHTGMALDMVENSLQKMGEELLKIASGCIPIAIHGEQKDLDDLRLQDKKLDAWHERILGYIGLIQQQELSDKELVRIRKQTDMANIMENAGDLYTTNIVEAAEHRLEEGFHVSQETGEMIIQLFIKANENLKIATDSYQNKDGIKAKEVLKSKKQFARECTKVHDHVYGRISDQTEHRVSIIRFEIELLEVARQIHSLARRIARRAVADLEKNRKKKNLI